MSIQDVSPAFRNPPDFEDLNGVKVYLKDSISKVARALQDIDFMINGTLDVNNIRAEGIEATNIKANAITTDKIQAGAVTADKITVNELSAISANLGHIVAGLIESIEIYGSYIATRNGAYPRCEMSNTGNLFGAYRSSGDSVTIEPNYGGSPSIVFNQGGSFRGRLDTLLGMELYGQGVLYLMGSSAVSISAPVIEFPSWNSMRSISVNRTLQQEFDNLMFRIERLEQAAGIEP